MCQMPHQAHIYFGRMMGTSLRLSPLFAWGASPLWLLLRSLVKVTNLVFISLLFHSYKTWAQTPQDIYVHSATKIELRGGEQNGHLLLRIKLTQDRGEKMANEALTLSWRKQEINDQKKTHVGQKKNQKQAENLVIPCKSQNAFEGEEEEEREKEGEGHFFQRSVFLSALPVQEKEDQTQLNFSTYEDGSFCLLFLGESFFSSSKREMKNGDLSAYLFHAEYKGSSVHDASDVTWHWQKGKPIIYLQLDPQIRELSLDQKEKNVRVYATSEQNGALMGVGGVSVDLEKINLGEKEKEAEKPTWLGTKITDAAGYATFIVPAHHWDGPGEKKIRFHEHEPTRFSSVDTFFFIGVTAVVNLSQSEKQQKLAIQKGDTYTFSVHADLDSPFVKNKNLKGGNMGSVELWQSDSLILSSSLNEQGDARLPITISLGRHEETFQFRFRPSSAYLLPGPPLETRVHNSPKLSLGLTYDLPLLFGFCVLLLWSLFGLAWMRSFLLFARKVVVFGRSSHEHKMDEPTDMEDGLSSDVAENHLIRSTQISSNQPGSDLFVCMGQVIDAHDEHPLQQIKISLYEKTWDRELKWLETESDHRGLFHLHFDPPYRISSLRPAFLRLESPLYRPFTLRLTGSMKLEVKLVLRRRAILNGLLSRSKKAGFSSSKPKVDLTPGQIQTEAKKSGDGEFITYASQVERAVYGAKPVDEKLDVEIESAIDQKASPVYDAKP